jgi:hypothetical protein
MDLREWVIEYIKHRDLFRKQIVKIEDKSTEVLVTYKNNSEHILISPKLSDAFVRLDDKKNMSVVTLNKKENLNDLIKSWHKLSQNVALTIYFVNPESNTEQKWIIRPHLHSKVADDDALKPGLQSMFSMVEEAA